MGGRRKHATAFGRELARRAVDPAGRRWLFVPYDQLSDAIGPLAHEPADELGLVVVESPWKAARRPYHRQKLALVLANLRHFALEQAGRGVAVRHVVAAGPYATALEPLARELGGLRVMRPAERALRVDLAPLAEQGLLQIVPHEGWLSSDADFEASQKGGPPWRMDRFYQAQRRRTGLLMEDGKPLGGKFSFDAENRRPWKGEPPAPEPARFRPDAVTLEVCELVEERFARHPGELRPEALPVTAQDARALWRWAKREALPHFGPFEDAMSERSSTLFHTRLSSLLNLQRLLARDVVREVAALELPLASREGFVRQVLGWREFVRHVHERTDGFRELPAAFRRDRRRVATVPAGDGGYAAWKGEPWSRGAGEDEGLESADPSFLGAARPLPPAWWGAPSGLACLDRVVADVWREGYGHHITRLMVLANLATLLDVSPRALTDWFWCAYTDAFEWVVEPNVLAMGTFAAGELMTTKPYVSGAAYLDRMSDFCGSCAFDPKRSCPITRLYWAFLARHAERFEGNARMALMLRLLARRPTAERREDRATFERVSRALAAGDELVPEGRSRRGAGQRGSPNA